MTHPRTLSASARVATKVLKTFEEGRPDLVPIGIPPVDDAIGGLFPGTVGILAMKTGVGKSRLKLTAALENAKSGIHTGLIELEDPPDVVGVRALAAASGVDSLRIRRKDLSVEEVTQIQNAVGVLDGFSDWLHLNYRIGGSIEDTLEAMNELSENGARIIWIDYIGKIRGVGQERRNEIGRYFGMIQKRADKLGVVVMVVSQVRRIPGDQRLDIHMLKESGDLENEARLILLGDVDRHDSKSIFVSVAKSTYGGTGICCLYRTNQSGNLELCLQDDNQPSQEEEYEDL